MILQGYMLAEDSRVLIPVNVCYDGFYSSHLVERVELPSQADADAFLPPYSLPAKLDPRTPQALDPMTPGELLMKYRRGHLESMKAALAVIDEVDAKFAAAFGRSYGGCIDTYRMEDADFALVTVGGMTGTARDAVDEARERGIRAGVVKLRFIRPFPAERIKEALTGVKGFAVVDRSVSFGWNAGPMYVETCAALGEAVAGKAHFSAIGGLGGADISMAHMERVIEALAAAAAPGGRDTLWLTD